MRDTVILLSGGLDSAVLCAVERHRIGLALFVEYGQPAEREECAAAQAIANAPTFDDGRIDLRYLRLSMPGMDEMNAPAGVGARVVPARNLVLLSHAINLALATGHTRIIFGATDGDRASYVDCRRAFVDAVNAASSLLGVSVDAPLLGLTKRKVVALGKRHRSRMALSWSCYRPTMGRSCGLCNACVERVEALR